MIHLGERIQKVQLLQKEFVLEKAMVAIGD